MGRAELGLIWEHFKALAPIGTKSQIWDIITNTVLVVWFFFFSETKFFRNQNRDFFLKPNFPKPKPSKIWQKFRNREVSKPKCQSLPRGNKNGPQGNKTAPPGTQPISLSTAPGAPSSSQASVGTSGASTGSSSWNHYHDYDRYALVYLWLLIISFYPLIHTS